MEPKAATTSKHLAVDPLASFTQLSIAGRRIRARTLYGRFMSAEEPMTPAEIAEDYNLPIEAVREAIAYCQSDPPEIRADFERSERLYEEARMKNPECWKDGVYRPPLEEIAKTRKS
jgi:uncharacterized protein (DUF433 family)